jgi:molybdate transport system ATP-binding protein
MNAEPGHSPARLHARLQASRGERRIELELSVSQHTLVLIGPNGAGKTTLLLLLLGLLRPQSGRIQLGAETLYDSDANIDVAVEARQLAYVPQTLALFPHLTVQRNVEFGLLHACSRGARSPQTAGERRDQALHWLDQLHIAGLAARRPHELSSGERQRVALARALAAKPKALLLDEPLGLLDLEVRAQVREFLRRTLQELHLPTILVTHDPSDALELGDQVLALEQGRAVGSGTLEDLARDPPTSFVREFTRQVRVNSH